MACNMPDVDLEVYMVKVSYEQKPYRRIMMEAFGANVLASPSDRTALGWAELETGSKSPDSLGIAVSETVEAAASSGGAMKYSLGSVLNHVLMYQTIIGEETLLQCEIAGECPELKGELEDHE